MQVMSVDDVSKVLAEVPELSQQLLGAMARRLEDLETGTTSTSD